VGRVNSWTPGPRLALSVFAPASPGVSSTAIVGQRLVHLAKHFSGLVVGNDLVVAVLAPVDVLGIE
jgi:hypothetical protein